MRVSLNSMSFHGFFNVGKAAAAVRFSGRRLWGQLWSCSSDLAVNAASDRGSLSLEQLGVLHMHWYYSLTRSLTQQSNQHPDNSPALPSSEYQLWP